MSFTPIPRRRDSRDSRYGNDPPPRDFSRRDYERDRHYDRIPDYDDRRERIYEPDRERVYERDRAYDRDRQFDRVDRPQRIIYQSSYEDTRRFRSTYEDRSSRGSYEERPPRYPNNRYPADFDSQPRRFDSQPPRINTPPRSPLNADVSTKPVEYSVVDAREEDLKATIYIIQQERKINPPLGFYAAPFPVLKETWD